MHQGGELCDREDGVEHQAGVEQLIDAVAHQVDGQEERQDRRDW